jgi:hypothetical protein
LQDAQTARESWPKALRYECLNDSKSEAGVSDDNILTIVPAYLDYHHSRLLLLQYLARHADSSRCAFLETAAKILATVVKATTYRVPPLDLSLYYSWVVCGLCLNNLVTYY